VSLNGAADVFITLLCETIPFLWFSHLDIGMQKTERNLQSTDTSGDELPGALEQCVQNSHSVKTAVEDELE
jgi:hypothetical protein